MSALAAIVVIAIEVKIDPYLDNTLMRDLVAHDRSASSFLVYFHLYCQTLAVGRPCVAVSHSVLADSVGLSKRSVQSAIRRLIVRRLLRSRKANTTSVPIYTVLTPWLRAKPGPPDPHF
jgi:hypothetical protein